MAEARRSLSAEFCFTISATVAVLRSCCCCCCCFSLRLDSAVDVPPRLFADGVRAWKNLMRKWNFRRMIVASRRRNLWELKRLQIKILSYGPAKWTFSKIVYNTDLMSTPSVIFFLALTDFCFAINCQKTDQNCWF